MKKLMTIAAGLLITGSAFANTVTVHRDAKLLSADYATKAEALSAGYDIADDLAAMSQNELRKEFVLFSENSLRSLTLDQTEITTEEFARSRDNIQYRAIVDVNYHFNKTESN